MRTGGIKPYGEMSQLWFLLKRGLRAAASGWWYLRTHKDKTEQFTAQRLVEATKHFKKRFA